MEFPDLGKHCSESFCHQIDFLPVKCDACHNIFCKDHFTYTQHQCPSAYMKDVQVPVCPLCSKPVPIKRGDLPDAAVSLHIDNDCASDPAVKKRKIYTNKCNRRGCKVKELIKVTCESCGKNFCLNHRHASDHDCSGPGCSSSSQPTTSRAGLAALQRMQISKSSASKNGSKPALQWSGNVGMSNVPMTRDSKSLAHGNSALSALQGNLSEDEALAQALQASLSQPGNMSQEDIDRQIAEAMAASDAHRSQNRSQRNVNSCSMS